jgi:hypothetical protein
MFDWLKKMFSPTQPIRKQAVRESWGFPAQPMDWQGDSMMYGSSQYLGIGFSPYGVNNPIDRAYGADYPFVRNELDLGRLRAVSRFIYKTNSNASGTIQAIRGYVIGKGFKPHFIGSNAELVKQCRNFLKDWMKKTKFIKFQKECFERSQVDGEDFVRLFPSEDGYLQFRSIEPELVCMPYDATFFEWSFGIKTDVIDTQNIKGYNVRYNGPNGSVGPDTFVEADKIKHIKMFCTEKMKRGEPAFAFSTAEMFNLSLKLTRNVGEGSAIQAAIAAIREHDGSTAAQIDDFLDTQKSGYPYAPNLPNNLMPSAFDGYQTVTPGAILDMTTNTKYIEPPGGRNVTAHLEVLQGLLRCAGSRWNAPEWVVSGKSGEMSNASSLTAESPFLRTCTSMQDDYGEFFESIIMAAMKNAALAGLIPLEWEDEVELVLTAPSIEVRDKGAEARMNKEYVEMGIKSKHRICSENDWDYEEELANRRQEAVEDPVPPMANQARVIPGGDGKPAEIIEPVILQQSADKANEDKKKDSKPGEQNKE